MGAGYAGPLQAPYVWAKFRGTFAKHEVSCTACDVFKQIQLEEGVNFTIWKFDGYIESPIFLRVLLNNLARHEQQHDGEADKP